MLVALNVREEPADLTGLLGESLGTEVAFGEFGVIFFVRGLGFLPFVAIDPDGTANVTPDARPFTELQQSVPGIAGNRLDSGVGVPIMIRPKGGCHIGRR
jgi:hypothetical protein